MEQIFGMYLYFGYDYSLTVGGGGSSSVPYITMKKPRLSIGKISTDTLEYIMAQFVSLEELDLLVLGYCENSNEQDHQHVKAVFNRFDDYCTGGNFKRAICIFHDQEYENTLKKGLGSDLPKFLRHLNINN